MNRLRLLVSWLTMLLLAAPVAAQAPETVRVMSYNIRIDVPGDSPPWDRRRPHMAAQIAFVDPDILGLQEAGPAQVEWLADALSGYDRYGLGRDDGKAVGETTTLLWRRDRFEALDRQTRWCSPTPERPSLGWDAAYPRTVTRVLLRDRLTGRLWDVRNTHFDHVGTRARLECAALIVDTPVAEGARLVVMGDFNTGPDTEPYRRILAAGLHDARERSPLRFGPEGTFNGFDISRDNEGVAIDHVFVGSGVDVTRFAVLTDSVRGQVISDHYPLVADLTAAP